MDMGDHMSKEKESRRAGRRREKERQ